MKRSPRPPTFNPRLYALFACSLAIVLLLGSVFSLPSFSGSAPSPTQALSLRQIPDTDLNPFGGNFFLDWEVEPWKVEKTLEMAKDAGLGWANVHFVWEGLEPKKGRFWDDRLNKSTWDKYDFIVNVAQKYGLKIIARLDRPPTWSREDNSRLERPPDNFGDYGNFVDAVVSRYKGRIGYYQIWNEPNIFPEWGNQEVDPAAYVRLLGIAYQRAKKADPNVRILSAPLAQTTETGPHNLNELDYLSAMYRAGAKDYFDILYANGYGFDSPPDDPPAPDKLNFARVTLLRQVMDANGDANKAVWFHEFGWNAAPPSIAQDKLTWRRVTEQQQAEYTVQAVRKARAEWPWAGVFSIWYFRQDGHFTPDQAEYYFRMVDPGFTPRIIYSAVQSEASGLGVAGPGAYQESNPALTVDSGWQEERQSLASAGTWLVADKQGASVTIKFAGTDFALVVKEEPQGARLLVTVDGRAANLLPASGEDRSYLDLHNPQAQVQVVKPVAGGLPYGQHVVRVVVGPAPDGAPIRHAVIDGFRVSVDDQTSWPDYSVVGGLSIIALLCLVVLWRRRRAGAGPRA